MKTPAMNPYLPLWEYIPDGEPRVFENRLYVYGSHDFAGGDKGFCPGDYMSWSAPLDDLGDWTCHGVSYPRSETPDMDPADAMAAPDVVQGPDGRYYLYYNTNGQKICRVAVSDSPKGPFTYYGDVRLPDGTPYDEYKMFDPGVLVDDDGRVYLFIGFCMPGPVPERYRGLKSPFAETSLGFELAADMCTIKAGPMEVIPGGNRTEGTSFVGHGIYEASSPRKINGKYVMAYSSELSHEMAYALADAPLGPYTYAGALVSNADLGLDGSTDPVMPFGNVHGGLVQLNGDWYIFYHRQTSGIECSRQGCAEKLPIREDGWFGMAEITSCGLNNGPLPAAGEYNACYCCHLAGPGVSKEKLSIYECRRAAEPHIYEEDVDGDETHALHYIANLKPGTVVGFKYFAFENPAALTLTVRGTGSLKVTARLDRPAGKTIGCAEAALNGGWQTVSLPIAPVSGTHALYLEFDAEGAQFRTLAFC